MADALGKVIPMGDRRMVRVLCLFRYFTRAGNVTKVHNDSIMIRVASSRMIRAMFGSELHRRYGDKVARGYEFVGYVPEHGRADF